ncbi:DNA polymerase delta catalytic subunit [Auxenochlorella protothecoides]|uniref:DNA-directed DNA polymerase n=1 Tax=Auxenochlorella protothecoides TaxID=3075 RepID=A0A087STD6_AUXPR|nr:DNA polymerase delta catalytic subunit [Auxenochlorella protothecoides]KFM28990.1 DNA polymerase delta catalytic subunit [Auxenochlorella protothecoides]
MALDILEDDHGQFTIWGASASGASVLLQVQGFRPYLYVVAPAAMPGSAPALDWFEDRGLRESFRAVVNRAIPPDLRVAAVLACDRRPLQYCRPADLGPAASPMLRLEFDPGTSLRRAAPVLARCLASPGLLEAGWNFGAGTMFESEIGLLQRFLADMPVSGGAWLYVPPAASPKAGAPAPGYTLAQEDRRAAGFDIDATAPWQALTCLTPDATQLADAGWSPFPPGSAAAGYPASGARTLVFRSEAAMLRAFLAWLRAADPDLLAVFDAGRTLGALGARCAALRVDGGAAALGRAPPGSSRSRPLRLKRITTYSAAWVRSQSRMSSTSNQETLRAEVDGRVVVDVQRQVLTSQNLSTFTLTDCVQSLLGGTLETLAPREVAALAAGDGAGLLRLARYMATRARAVRALLLHLATVPDMVEMARVTGLTLGQVAYQAQMVRTHSLLLRTAGRRGYVLPARLEAGQLQEHTFILHPVENRTAGLYTNPVAILDFASLYPSIYRAHNLCYTTLVHPEDRGLFAEDQTTVTPTGDVFVKPAVRKGLLPAILAALTVARAATRDQLKAATSEAQRAVLDGRQKALKVTANALYGFTGAQTSPLQCIPLADSCLAYGAQACRRALDALESASRSGELGPIGRGARVIYGHTDSLCEGGFAVFPAASTPAEAIEVGKRTAAIVSAAFPDPMELKFERVCNPLLLIHVNRYAGKTWERPDSQPALMGLVSMWRQAAPIVRTTLHGVLERIIMRGDVESAIAFVEEEVRRLLSGRVSLHELIMTQGLWRITGEQVSSAAAGDPAAAAEVRGPHASLAVRLVQRDPGRAFVLGERLPYVLLAGAPKQDDAAEDPVMAVRSGTRADYLLYWNNKLVRPLSEMLGHCMPPARVQALMQGAHTRVRVEEVGSRVAKPGGASLSPPTPSPRAKGRRQGGRQVGMTAFYAATAKCIGCKRTLPQTSGTAPALCEICSRQAGATHPHVHACRGLQRCRVGFAASALHWPAMKNSGSPFPKTHSWIIACLPPQQVRLTAAPPLGRHRDPGIAARVVLETTARQAEAEALRARAGSICRACDSATLTQPFLCENGACAIYFQRREACIDLEALGETWVRLRGGAAG